MQTVRVRPAPVVLIVNPSAAFLRRCGDVAIQVQAVVVEANEQSFQTLAAQTRSIAVVMLEETFAKSPAMFTAMAKEAGTPIITIADENIPQADLEARILGAISNRDRLRR